LDNHKTKISLKIALFAVLLVSALNVRAQESKPIYKTGDLIFQDLDCGGLCDAIEDVTQGYKDYRFSHVGLVYGHNDSLFAIESIGPGVKLTYLPVFLQRTNINVPARLKAEFQPLIAKAIEFSIAQLGKPYDDEFIYDNGKYYCSELLYDAFKYANNNEPFFELQPMTFKKPGTDSYFPVWEDYYGELKMEIPEGEMGCNPGGLSRSDRIDILK